MSEAFEKGDSLPKWDPVAGSDKKFPDSWWEYSARILEKDRDEWRARAERAERELAEVKADRDAARAERDRQQGIAVHWFNQAILYLERISVIEDSRADAAKGQEICQSRLDSALAALRDALWVCETADSFPDLQGRLRAALSGHAVPVAAPFDLVKHLHRQRSFSEKTFGPGERFAGVLDHIRKELVEIEKAPTDLTEWVDVVLLALDGAWRAGHSPEQIAAAIGSKQAKNEARTWPDWRTAEHGKAIEHVRGDAPPAEHPALEVLRGCLEILEVIDSGSRMLEEEDLSPLLREVRSILSAHGKEG